MPKSQFRHVTDWVFDLDNTLYPPAVRLFDQIEKRMTRFVMETLGLNHASADKLRHDYWQTYGTTLAGLMREHDIAPEAYLDVVHDINFDALTPDPHLAQLIRDLPGRKIVYTNGSAPYAARVLEARGLEAAFDAIYGVEHAAYTPKPERSAFERVFGLAGVTPDKAAMFEDEPRNLAAPHAMGLQTVHVAPTPQPADHIHHHTDDLPAFLRQIS